MKISHRENIKAKLLETIELVIEGFPYSTIEKIEEKPTYCTIKEVEWKLIRNELSYQIELGDGNHRYLGLVLLPTEHNLLVGSDFAPHLNAGSLPIFPANIA